MLNGVGRVDVFQLLLGCLQVGHNLVVNLLNRVAGILLVLNALRDLHRHTGCLCGSCRVVGLGKEVDEQLIIECAQEMRLTFYLVALQKFLVVLGSQAFYLIQNHIAGRDVGVSTIEEPFFLSTVNTALVVVQGDVLLPCEVRKHILTHQSAVGTQVLCRLVF